MEPFINASLGAVALVTLGWLGCAKWRSGTLLFWYEFLLSEIQEIQEAPPLILSKNKCMSASEKNQAQLW